MFVVAPTPKHQLLAFEVALLDATAAALQASEADLLKQQLFCINRVQRLLDWREIEFYSMRWFRVQWPGKVLFERRDEFRLAQIDCTFGSKSALVDVWAVGGHVSSLESTIGFSALSISGPLRIQTVSIVS